MSGYRSEPDASDPNDNPTTSPYRGKKIPGDFSFKVVEGSSEETGSDDTISMASGLLYLGLALVAFLALFFSTFSLHAKFHLFVLCAFIGVWIYNYRVYGKPPEGASYLDSYQAFSISEEGESEELGRFGKWRRLIWSMGEPPNPEFDEPSGEEPDRSSASLRTLLEWAVLIGGIGWGTVQFFRYYFGADGPFFHDIFGVYIVTLLIGIAFWLAVWIKQRMSDEWDAIRRHVESLNFFICRWIVGYLVLWCIVALIWLMDQ